MKVLIHAPDNVDGYIEFLTELFITAGADRAASEVAK